MPKKHKSRRHIKNQKHKKRRTRRIRYKGGNDTKVECCMCRNEVNKNKTYVPRICLNEHGERAHRICENCWWNDFAREGVNHKCPGCLQDLPLTKYEKRPPVLIDLTEE